MKAKSYRVALLSLVMVSVLLTGCKATDPYWTFPAIRDLGRNGLAVIGGGGSGSLGSCSSQGKCGDCGKGLIFALAFFLTSPLWEPVLRFGIDVALLPITLPHDAYIYYLRRQEERSQRKSLEPDDEFALGRFR
ncbi:MAG: hypothetical protein ACYS47_02140 [Planctomycetota bacterium]|jgi:hypothetical protein